MKLLTKILFTTALLMSLLNTFGSSFSNQKTEVNNSFNPTTITSTNTNSPFELPITAFFEEETEPKEIIKHKIFSSNFQINVLNTLIFSKSQSLAIKSKFVKPFPLFSIYLINQVFII